VAGQPIKPIEYDNKTDPKISMEVAQKLVESVVRDIIIRQAQKKDGVVKNVVLNVIPQVLHPPQGFTLVPRK
jgi:hypothetical protein